MRDDISPTRSARKRRESGIKLRHLFMPGRAQSVDCVLANAFFSRYIAGYDGWSSWTVQGVSYLSEAEN